MIICQHRGPTQNLHHDFKSFDGPMATPAALFIFMEKQLEGSSLPEGSGGRPADGGPESTAGLTRDTSTRLAVTRT